MLKRSKTIYLQSQSLKTVWIKMKNEQILKNQKKKKESMFQNSNSSRFYLEKKQTQQYTKMPITTVLSSMIKIIPHMTKAASTNHLAFNSKISNSNHDNSEGLEIGWLMIIDDYYWKNTYQRIHWYSIVWFAVIVWCFLPNLMRYRVFSLLRSYRQLWSHSVDATLALIFEWSIVLYFSFDFYLIFWESTCDKCKYFC